MVVATSLWPRSSWEERRGGRPTREALPVVRPLRVGEAQEGFQSTAIHTYPLRPLLSTPIRNRCLIPIFRRVVGAEEIPGPPPEGFIRVERRGEPAGHA